MTTSERSNSEQYRVVLLTKAGIGGAKRNVLKRLIETDVLTVVGIVVEDMIHGPLTAYVGDTLRRLLRYRGRGYPVRTFYAARDVFRTIQSRLSTTDAETVDDEATETDPLADVPIIEVSDMTSNHAAGQIRALNPDLGIVWGTRILPQQIFDIPTNGSVGIHAGKIPEYRGGPAGFWELYYGESEAGVTVQKLNEALDAGQIVAQRTVPIEAGDSPADIRERQHAITENLVVDAVVGLAEDSLKPRDWGGEKRPVNTPPTVLELLRFRLRQWSRRRHG
jgi:folate-dependent phosphoribosylglycinamide formyltransferase PurN